MAGAASSSTYGSARWFSVPVHRSDDEPDNSRRNYLYSPIHALESETGHENATRAPNDDLMDPLSSTRGLLGNDLADESSSSLPSRGLGPRIQQLWSQISLAEVSGSCGDLGTFIPLFVALGRERSIYVAPALFLAGFSNLVTGYVWDLPLPVQPMKAIAAVALVGELDRLQVTTAGIWMGILLLALGLTNAIEWVNKLVPRSVVSGVQLGVGAGLALRGIDLIVGLSWFGAVDCRALAVVAATIALFLMREGSRAPVGIALFGAGALIALGHLLWHQPPANDPSPEGLSWQFAPILASGLQGATWDDWRIGLLEGALPQLPLSTLNTVISTCCLVQSLYPHKANHPTRRQMSVSVGLMNILLCPLGAMPTCHGAGGLAGQHKFGARHGASVVLLGLAKMLLAAVFGGSILSFLDLIPASILGVMLTISGHSLALTGWTSLLEGSTPTPVRLKQEATVALLTMLAILGFKKTHYGALCGWVAHMVYGDGWADLCGTRNRGIAGATPGHPTADGDDDDAAPPPVDRTVETVPLVA